MKKTKLVWIMVEEPTHKLVKEIKKAIESINLENYAFICTSSSLRPISIKTLKKYLETLLQQVKDLES